MVFFSFEKSGVPISLLNAATLAGAAGYQVLGILEVLGTFFFLKYDEEFSIRF